MHQSYRSRFLSVQATNERRMAALFRDLAAGIASDVVRRADADGNVPRTATFDLQRLAGERIQRLYLGMSRNGQLAPFEIGAGGKVIPLSPYMQALWDAIAAAVRIPVEQNAAILAKRLPPDVLAVMRAASENPFATARGQVTEIEVFKPNPLAQYEAPHTWVDPRGYRLSDRVWDTAGSTRRAIDAYLEDAIRQGKGALAMSKELVQFLDPSQLPIKTNKPYGTKASFSAMRLARTEITRAHGEAHKVAGAMNPFVAGDKWNLSSRHPKPDICDRYARGGPNGDGVYPTGELPPYPPHPQCVTPGQMVNTERGSVAIEDVKVGDHVLTHMGRYRQVLSTWATPHDGLVYRLETGQGCFEVTGNHPVLLRSGWVNAEFVKPGDEILYTRVGVGVDFLISEMDKAPALAFDPGITSVKKGSCLAPMPIVAVAFNPNLYCGEGNVNEVASHLHLFFVDDTGIGEGCVHGDLQGARVGESNFSMPQEHGDKAGVALPLCFGDFEGDFGALGRVIITGEVEQFVGFRHSTSVKLTSASVILLPTGSNSVAPVAHGNAAHSEQIAQDTVSNSILSIDLGAREPLINVNVSQQFGNGRAHFGFEAHGVKSGGRNAVNFVMSPEIIQGSAADGASNHYSLLSLNPDEWWGAESGNSVVGEVANPSQALDHYTTVRSVGTLQYTGKVYNMTVADDHSYTVGGHVVHNCLCNLTYAMVSDPDAIIAALRKDIRQARAELVNQVGPLQVEQFDKLLLGQYAPAAAPALPTPAAIPTPPVVVPRPAVPPAPTAPKVDLKPLKDGKATIVWEKAPLYANRKLNGVALKEVSPGYWAKVPDVAVGEPALPTGQRVSTGLIVVEPDGRIWLVEPRGHFGGYEHTFPKGGLEAGLTAQQNALKEVWEEAGLKAEITGYVGDFKGTTSTTRYYIAKRTGGAPWATDDETATVKLVPMDVARKLLNTQRDQDILAAVEAKLATPPPPVVPPAIAPLPPTPPPLPVAGADLPGLDELRLIKRLGGSTGAQLFEGPGGKRYVVKGGNSDAHIRSEFLADELYRAMGANVPRARLVQKDGQTFKIAEYIDGKLLNELSGDALAAAHAQLQKHFAADALLASWDVIGAGADNVIVDAAGKAWRIDNGGSLLFRAQGAPKQMGNYLDELWTLRDKAVNAQTHKVFGDINYSIVANQLTGIVRQRNDIIGRISDPTLRTIMTARLDHAADLVQIYNTLGNDKYLDGYIDRFSYHNTWIQSTGVTSTLPKRLTGKDGVSDVLLVDENGKAWDDLRGKGGIYAKFLKELDLRTGGKASDAIYSWTSEQASDSWEPMPRRMKELIMQYRPSDYFVQKSDDLMDSAIAIRRKRYGDDLALDVASALNALSYETLRRVDVGTRPTPGILHLFRTEREDVLRQYGFTTLGQTGKIKRGAAESTSIMTPVAVHGGRLTEQDVPIHRVFGFYGFGIDRTIYYSDSENELLALLDGLTVTYTKVIR